jgi:hypothetical protein
MNTEHNIEERLWNYIDGVATSEERSAIEKLLQENVEWQRQYRQLLDVHQMLNATELDEPSMRFTRNVMEEIAKYHIAPATKSYINKKIVFGIGWFFALMFIGFLIYGVGQINWSQAGDTTLPTQITDIEWSKFFNNTYVNIFMMINVVLGLMLLDRYLTNKKTQAAH